MFLTIPDLSSSAYPELVQALSRYSDDVILVHLNTAQSTIEAHLVGRYNIGPELAKEGEARNALLVQIGRSLAIYYLYGPAPTMPDRVQKDYDRSLKLLEMYSAGQLILPNVPAPSIESTVTPSGIAGGSTPLRTTYY